MFSQGALSIIFPESLKHFDNSLFFKINGEWHNTFFDWLLPLTRETFFWIPFYFFLLLFATSNFKKHGWLWVLFLIINVVVSDYVSSTLIKEHIMHLRPCHDTSITEHVRFLVKYCPSSSGFTSSHACNFFAAAMFIFTTLNGVIGKWRWLLFLWAFIPSYAQVYVGVHFPTDIIGGAVLGLLLGYIVGYIFNKRVGLMYLM
ncbi:MAG: phosphatase PAP2 family protein [Bacteroidota bacterium]|nr:phosphatase PAP2 family protein [Bacteroidota bacterium]